MDARGIMDQIRNLINKGFETVNASPTPSSSTSSPNIQHIPRPTPQPKTPGLLNRAAMSVNLPNDKTVDAIKAIVTNLKGFDVVNRDAHLVTDEIEDTHAAEVSSHLSALRNLDVKDDHLLDLAKKIGTITESVVDYTITVIDPSKQQILFKVTLLKEDTSGIYVVFDTAITKNVPRGGKAFFPNRSTLRKQRPQNSYRGKLRPSHQRINKRGARESIG